MILTDSTKQFILHWGEMGTRWGVNRTVAQVHALLYLSPEPLTAEDIAETLSVARSNVSTSLKELQNWNLVQIDSRIGDRRDFFQTSADVWALFLTVVEQRVEREIIPTLTMLRRCATEAQAERPAQPTVTARITAMQVLSGGAPRLVQPDQEIASRQPALAYSASAAASLEYSQSTETEVGLMAALHNTRTDGNRAPAVSFQRYYEEAGPDYAAWSLHFNMHFGFFRWGINPFQPRGHARADEPGNTQRLSLISESAARVLDMGCGLGATLAQLRPLVFPEAELHGDHPGPLAARAGPSS